jgi:hypothetical protein
MLGKKSAQPPMPGKAPSSAIPPPMPGKAPSSAADVAAAAATALPGEDVHERIGNFNDDINTQKTRLVNVNARLVGVADKIKGFTNNGGDAVKDIEKQIADIKAKAEAKKTAASDKVIKGLNEIDLPALKKTIGEIGVVSVQIKSAVASEGEEVKTDITALLPLIKSFEKDGKKAQDLFPDVVISKLGGGNLEKGGAEFQTLFAAVPEPKALGGKKRKQTKKRRKAHRK